MHGQLSIETEENNRIWKMILLELTVTVLIQHYQNSQFTMHLFQVWSKFQFADEVSAQTNSRVLSPRPRSVKIMFQWAGCKCLCVNSVMFYSNNIGLGLWGMLCTLASDVGIAQHTHLWRGIQTLMFYSTTCHQPRCLIAKPAKPSDQQKQF